MPRKLTPDDTDPPTPQTAGLSTDDKLDMIVMYLHRMDKRDHWRTIGGFFRSMIAIIPILIFIWSTVYFLQHGTEIIKEITDQSVKSAASYSQQGLMDQFNDYINKQKK